MGDLSSWRVRPDGNFLVMSSKGTTPAALGRRNVRAHPKLSVWRAGVHKFRKIYYVFGTAAHFQNPHILSCSRQTSMENLYFDGGQGIILALSRGLPSYVGNGAGVTGKSGCFLVMGTLIFAARTPQRVYSA